MLLLGPRRFELTGEAPGYLRQFVDRLNTLLALPPGWDSYGAEVVSVDSPLAALGMLQRLPEALRYPNMSASPDGQVELEWANDDLLLVLVVSGSSTS